RGVERAGLVQRVRRARLDAERARAAVDAERRGRLDLDVGHERAEDDPGTVAARDQERVLAVEADARARGRLSVDVLVRVDEDAPDPEPGPGDVLVRLRAASLNHLDVWVRKGLPSVPKPRILGADGAGVIESVGDGVEGLAPGDRVVINPGIEHYDGRITVVGEHFDGTHAE